MEAAKDQLSTLQMHELTGATLRQLQWWDEQGILKPWFGVVRDVPGGPARRYSVDQVDVIRRIILLRKAGVSLHHLRKLERLPAWNKVVSAPSGYVVVGDALVVLRKPRGWGKK